MSREQISALADGELAESDVGAVLKVLRQSEEKTTWALYHQVGDLLRSDEMAVELSDDFTRKMLARLDAEPTIIAPQFKNVQRDIQASAVAGVAVAEAPAFKSFVRRFVVPGMAAAAAVSVVFFVTSPHPVSTLATSNTEASSKLALSAGNKITPTSAGQQAVVRISGLAQQGEVARDPRIDDYLLAHQQFSPSMYSSAQYARSAAFATESDK